MECDLTLCHWWWFWGACTAGMRGVCGVGSNLNLHLAIGGGGVQRVHGAVVQYRVWSCTGPLVVVGFGCTGEM